ncbi:MAG: mechanosensitive ion channel family protein [Actinobacteria bacterium]|nr:mechanosensitive ion channel family protein [Actinomycetota bacterium]
MSDIWNEVVDFLETYPYVRALAYIVGFALLAYVADKVLTGTLARLARRSENTFDDRLVRLLHRPVFLSVLFAGLDLAARSLEMSEGLERFTTLSLRTILVFVWVMFAYRFVRLLLNVMRHHPERFGVVQSSTEALLSNFMAVVFVLGGAYAIMVIWDINVTGLLASAGIVGLALSFAAQDTLSNLFAGVAILSDKPYELDDYIVLDSGERGRVTKIGLRSTRLLTRDDVEVSIPNGIMGAAKIVNEAGGPPARYRIRAGVGVSYGSDIEQVERVLVTIAADHPKVLDRPEPRARFRAFGDSSLDWELLCWITDPADRGLVLHELNGAIYRRFAAEGITIPFPQQDVHIKEMPGG